MRLTAYRSFLDQFATLLDSGIPVLEALSSIETGGGRDLSDVAGRLRERIENGAGLAEAMAADPSVFSRPHVALITAAERAGAVPGQIHRFRDEVDRTIAHLKDVVTRSLYPVLILVAAAVLSPAYLLFNGRTGAYLAREFFIFGSLGLLAWIVFHFRKVLLPWLYRAPFLGSIFRRFALGESLSLLGLLQEAGIGIEEALGLASGAARHGELSRQLAGAAGEIKSGKNLSEALELVREIPSLDRGRILVGEKAGATDRALRAVGSALEERARDSLDRIVVMLPFLLMGLVGAVVGYIYITTMIGHLSQRGLL